MHRIRRLLLVFAILWCAARSSAQTGIGTVTLSGSLTRADYEHLLEREFDVPVGVKRLKIALSYTGVDRRTVIDLGLRGPAGFRGWSGGGPQTIVLGPAFASYGYLPGPIEAGRWAVILGVPNIRAGSTDTYTITIEQLDHEEPAFPVLQQRAGWFAGDFHSHSGQSDGSALTNNIIFICSTQPCHIQCLSLGDRSKLSGHEAVSSPSSRL